MRGGQRLLCQPLLHHDSHGIIFGIGQLNREWVGKIRTGKLQVGAIGQVPRSLGESEGIAIATVSFIDESSISNHVASSPYGKLDGPIQGLLDVWPRVLARAKWCRHVLYSFLCKGAILDLFSG